MENMKYKWEDLPKVMNLFTVKDAVMVDLDTCNVIRRYCANTKIAVVQKCIIDGITYFRTQSAVKHNLNYAFEADSFGLETTIKKAPSAPREKDLKTPTGKRISKPVKKQKSFQKATCPKDGGGRGLKNLVKRIFRRKNG